MAFQNDSVARASSENEIVGLKQLELETLTFKLRHGNLTNFGAKREKPQTFSRKMPTKCLMVSSLHSSKSIDSNILLNLFLKVTNKNCGLICSEGRNRRRGAVSRSNGT